MDQKMRSLLESRLREENCRKLFEIKNPVLHEFVARFVELCDPAEVFVCTDSPEDIDYVRQAAVKDGEERMLALRGHTIHFDGFNDQARDKENTKFLVPKGVGLGSNINGIDREKGLEELRELMKSIMGKHGLYVRFYCLGPTGSEFSIPCVQLTDSSYVAHSEDLLYRRGYEEFKRRGSTDRFFKFVHSEGELEGGVCKNIDKRRVYIDTQERIVYSLNTQYGGNTIGLKKLAMRLSISLGSNEGWLTEHMFVMGVHGPAGRKSYFTGAFPSLCGKTSTSMLEGETIVGDDIAFLRKKSGKVYVVNVEKGMFGIMQGVNSKDDPILWKTLHAPGEIIFSNVLVSEGGDVYWIGKDGDPPSKGINHSGEWMPGKKGADGRDITPSHPNARFTLELSLLENVDPDLNNPEGVVVQGIIYGGRDSDTCVPVEESFDWVHGIITKGACLESETTAATLGQEGVRKYNPMSNLDFLSIPIGRYIQCNLDFGSDLEDPPVIFSVNYFLKGPEGDFLNEKRDKAVWLKWMELRSHKDVGAIETPTGLIPKYADLKGLFKEVLAKEYKEEDYFKQFTTRVPESLAKMDRMIELYSTKVPDTPQVVLGVLEEQRARLTRAREKFGDYISPNQY